MVSTNAPIFIFIIFIAIILLAISVCVGACFWNTLCNRPNTANETHFSAVPPKEPTDSAKVGPDDQIEVRNHSVTDVQVSSVLEDSNV
jgi:hypothetical protein